MKISFRPDGRRGLTLRFPTCLLLNGFTALLLARMLKRKAGKRVLSTRQLRRLFRAIRKEKKRLKGSWELVSVTTRDHLHITLTP